jgi:hypothetical protein
MEDAHKAAKPCLHRIDGNPRSRLIYFLPWRTSFMGAWSCGVLPLSYGACYRTPPEPVSAEPGRCRAVLRHIIDDALAVAEQDGRAGPPVKIGFSLGTVAATCVASQLRAPLLSICGAPRGEAMIWSSPAAAKIKRAAMGKGYHEGHFAAALGALNPDTNLARIDRRSLFIMALRDRLIPRAAWSEWTRTIALRRPGAGIIIEDAGHIGAILGARRRQVAWFQALGTG